MGQDTFILSSHSLAASRPIRSRKAFTLGMSAVVSYRRSGNLRLGGGTVFLFSSSSGSAWSKEACRYG